MEQDEAKGWANTTQGELHGLAETYGTPYFLYDADIVRRRIVQVREAFESTVGIYFAVKANPNLGLLQAVRSDVDGLDISSVGELEQACLAGYDPAQLSFAGPGKSPEEVRISVERGVGCISVESLRELRACAEAARSVGQNANITLRVNPLLQNRGYGMKMGGRPIQFGIDEEHLPEALDEVAANSEHLEFRGIHVYAGSQCFDPNSLLEGITNTLRIASAAEARLGRPCAIVNLGGGFGVSQTDEDRELDVAAAARDILATLRAFKSRPGGPREIFFELGRYLAADAGLYVCRVLSRKISRGKTFYVVDGGLHHHLAAAGTFGAALRTNFRLRNLSRPDAPRIRCSIAGPSCNPTDLLAVDLELAAANEGDLVGVLKSGSYGLTASPVLFLGRPTAIEIVRSDGHMRIGRGRHTLLDFN